MTPTAFALLALSLVLAAFLPVAYRVAVVLERLSTPTAPGETPKLRDGTPVSVPPLLRLLEKPAAPVEDEAAVVRRRDDYLQQYGVHLPPPPPRGVTVDTSTLTPVREIR